VCGVHSVQPLPNDFGVVFNGASTHALCHLFVGDRVNVDHWRVAMLFSVVCRHIVSEHLLNFVCQNVTNRVVMQFLYMY